MKLCKKCGTYLEETCFSIRKGKLQSYCKECQAEYSREYRKNNRESCNSYLKEWRQNNPKPRKELSPKQRLAEFYRSKFRRLLVNPSEKQTIFGYSGKELAEFLKDYPDCKISYKVPLSEFELYKEEEIKRAFSFDNLKPL